MCNNCVEEIKNVEIKVEELVNIQTGKKIDMKKFAQLKDNTMLKVRPELWCEWDFERNDGLGLDIYKVSYGSGKTAWWYCKNCNNSFDRMIKLKTKGVNNCPYCSNQRLLIGVNDIWSTHPNVAEMLVNPEDGYKYSYGSETKVYWKCNNVDCGSIFEAIIYNMTRKPFCPYCSSKKANHSNSLASLNPQLASEWHPTLNGNLTPYDRTITSNKKAWWVCEKGHEWEAIISNRSNKGHGCPYCGNRQLLVGFNDMWTTNPELAKLLLNPEDGYKYMQSSGQYVDWKCCTCGEVIKNKKISHIVQIGVNCPNCSDGISYPEKVMYHVLKKLNIEFEWQIMFKWSDRKLYDFYIPSLNIIIETHGGQHYDENKRGRSLKEEKWNDELKHKLALENGIERYVVIDCRKSDIGFIKNNILNSELKDFFDLSNLDWKVIDVNSQKSINIEILDLWNKGLLRKEIAEITKVSTNTVYRVLKNFDKLGLCNYNGKERTFHEKKQKRIYQFTTEYVLLRIWENVNEINDETGFSTNSIYKSCNKTSKTSHNFIWRYEEDVINWSTPIDYK